MGTESQRTIYLKIAFSNFTTGSTVLPYSSIALEIFIVASIDTTSSQTEASTRWLPGHCLVRLMNKKSEGDSKTKSSPSAEPKDKLLWIHLAFHLRCSWLHEPFGTESGGIRIYSFIAHHRPAHME